MQPVKLTKKAAEKIQSIMAAENLIGQVLRVGIRGGKCAGFEYILDFTDKTTDADYLYSSEGVSLAVDELSANYLNGTEIDYVDGLVDSGFKFGNPNATRHCGCAKSFNIE